ncbi:MAG: ABC transporter ATP-binding protein [Clostridium sp.]
MSLIKLENINKIYDGEIKFEALKNINIIIDEGELVAIVGPSGSGKSTLLSIIGCIDTQTSGKYYLNGIEISQMNPKNLAKIRNEEIGFIFQNFNLLNNYNLIDNVTLPLDYSNSKIKDKFKKAVMSLSAVGLEKHKLKTPKDLSGGEKQRVAIARALINNPKIILADEPTGALDQENGHKIMNILTNLNKEGITVIIITHDMNIASMCNKIINIEDGSIIN